MPHASSESEPRQTWLHLLDTVEELHNRGFTGIRALPTIGPIGYWRLAVTTADNMRFGVNLPFRNSDTVFRVTEGEFPRVGSLPVSNSTPVEDVVSEILRGLGSPRESTYVNDAEYCRWFRNLREQSEHIGKPPAAFSDSYNGWRCGDVDIAPPPGWEQ